MIERNDAFLDQLQSFLNAHSFPAYAVLNYGQAVLTLSGNKLVLKRINSRNKSRLNSELARERPLAPTIYFMQASGKAFMSIYMLKESFKGQEFAEANFEASNSACHMRHHIRRCYAWSDAGRLNAELFGYIMDICYDKRKAENPGLNCILLGGNFDARKGMEAIRKMLSEGAFLLFFPEGASRFLQPLNSCPFASFKRRMNAIFEGIELGASLLAERRFKLLIRACREAEGQSMAESAIQRGF